MKFLLAVAVCILTACSHTAKVPQATVAKDSATPSLLAGLDVARLTGGTPGIEKYTIRMTKCGFWNAFAIPSEKEIVLCSELASAGPAVMRMVVLHEAGHAGFDSGMSFTGMEELAADEYAAVRSIWEGRREDVKAYADFWAQDEGKLIYYIDFGYWDPHPSDSRRDWHARCLYIGSGPAPEKLWDLIDWYDCRKTWQRTDATWRKLLGKHA